MTAHNVPTLPKSATLGPSLSSGSHPEGRAARRADTRDVAQKIGHPGPKLRDRPAALPRQRSFADSFRLFTKAESLGSLIESAVGFGPIRCGATPSPGAFRFFVGLVIKIARPFCKQQESEPLFIA
jgi:hypothetical protein